MATRFAVLALQVATARSALVWEPAPSLLAGTLFYLNGIGIEGQGLVPNGMVKNYWTSFVARALA